MTGILLRNGVKIPQLGLGTWQITDSEIIKSVIEYGVKYGYRLIDTAAVYRNEISLARAINTLDITRRELFLSDKVWNTSRGYAEVQEACRRSLKKMKTDYFDLYLIHWPASMKLYTNWAELNAESWRGMERLYKDGLVRAIGVCNFKTHHLTKLADTAETMPFINQIECHPGYNQTELITYCCDNNIIVEASSPLGSGQILENDCLIEIGKKYNKSPAQICIRWAIQKKLVVIPKSEKTERLKENIDVFDFSLHACEMEAIDGIPYCGGIGIDSDEVTEFG